ncbi:retrovirus-related pol polyprotein from transposon TNT 1-94 [Tanacetum coccineum]|uniref:Retrovirus-related pol polyprotein from transposon TNT 1-94 n=1 Tax=Tanacetum coccineum TaxID=301880 RepID=A0ABQ5EN55_9ASTR
MAMMKMSSLALGLATCSTIEPYLGGASVLTHSWKFFRLCFDKVRLTNGFLLGARNEFESMFGVFGVFTRVLCMVLGYTHNVSIVKRAMYVYAVPFGYSHAYVSFHTSPENVIVAGADNHLPMLDKTQYSSWASPAFQTDDLDAFDSDCDEAPSASAVLMAKLFLYDSKTLSKETLELAEESRLKMHAKQNDPIVKEKKVNIAPIDYVALNKLSKHFVPQKQLYAEQAFWLPISKPVSKIPPVQPELVLKEVPRKLPTINLVHTAMKTLAAIADYQKMEHSYMDAYNECLELKIEISKKNDMVDKAVYNELSKRCVRLENQCISLEIKVQQYKESFQNNQPRNKQDAPEFPAFFEINELKAQLKAKDNSISKFKDYIATLKGKSVSEVEQARELRPLDSNLDSACNFATQIQELLVYVSATCPSSNKQSEKLIAVIQIVLWNDHVAKIKSYGDYQIGNVTISQHRRLSHLNFGTINDLDKQGLVKWLPKLKYQKDHLCFACSLGKSKKHTHKPKSDDSIQEKLYLLYMDLCGPMRIKSINGKKYILVIIDDYSWFTWVKFLRSKDETTEIVIKLLKKIQVRLNATVCNIRTDNGTEFVNQTLQAYYEDVGISHQTSVRVLYNRTTFEDLGKLKPKANIGIFVGYKPAKKAYRIYNWQTRLIMETIHVEFDELTKMASEQFSSGPVLQLMTSRTISSGLMQNPSSPTPYVLPTKNDCDILFQPMFDDYFNPSQSVVSPLPVAAALSPVDPIGSPSSTSIDQATPSTSTSLTIQET